MKKLLLLLCLNVFIILSTVQVMAEEKYAYVLKEDGTAEISGYSGTEEDITIPETIDGYKVTSIGAGAFKGNVTIKNLIIGENITYIGFEAFADCDKLTSVSICGDIEWGLEIASYKNSTPVMSNGVFAYCDKLNKVDLGNKLRSVPAGFTFGCISMKKIEIPPKVGDIGEGAFGYWEKNTTAQNPGDPEYIIKKGIEFYGYLRSVAEYYADFIEPDIILHLHTYEDDLIEQYYMDVNQDGKSNSRDALLVLKASADLIKFNYNEKMTGDADENGIINAEDALLILKKSAGINSRLKELIPGSNDYTYAMHEEGSNLLMFESYYNDMLITEPQENTEVLWADFAEEIESIAIHSAGDAVIETGVFDMFTNLKEIYFYCEDALQLDMDAINNENKAQIVVYGYSGTDAESFAISNDMRFEAIDCTQTQKVEGTDIYWSYDAEKKELFVGGNGAIEDCYFDYTLPMFGLDIDERTPWSIVEKQAEVIVIGDGITDIGKYAFKESYSMKVMYIPASVQTMSRIDEVWPREGADEMFICEPGSAAETYFIDYEYTYRTKKADAYLLKTNGYEYIAFADGTAEIVKYNGTEADIVIPEYLGEYKVNSIFRKAFEGNDYIKTLEIGEHIENVGFEAFISCPALESVKISGDIKWDIKNTQYANWAPYEANGVFAYCKSLKEIDLGNKLTTIPGGFTYGCTLMTKITVPESVVEIGSTALAYWRRVISDPDAVGSSSHGILSSAVIEGYSGSAAEEYANYTKVNFVTIK